MFPKYPLLLLLALCFPYKFWCSFFHGFLLGSNCIWALEAQTIFLFNPFKFPPRLAGQYLYIMLLGICVFVSFMIFDIWMLKKDCSIVKYCKYYFDQIVIPGSDPSLLGPACVAAPLSSPAHFGGMSPASRANPIAGVLWSDSEFANNLVTPSLSPKGVLLLEELMAHWLCAYREEISADFFSRCCFSLGRKGLEAKFHVLIWFLFL